MKLSIWQQFASNHSNGFTVVGKFDSEKEASKVATRLKEILEAIYLQSIGYGDIEPVQAELDYGKEFDIEWTKHLDWINTDEIDHVLQFNQYVVISDYHGSTWHGTLYIDQIMAKLASNVYGAGEMDVNVIAVELSCLAPDINVANSIYAELNPYFEDVRAEKYTGVEIPWHKFRIHPKSTDAYYGYIRQIGKKLAFDHLTFGTIGVGLPALIAYLKDKGCTEIKYTIKDAPMNEIYEEDN